MKTTQNIKQLLLGGIVALTLASCGGGGGGGGGESSSGSNNNNNNSTDNTVQQETYSAPERLSSGMEFTMTSAETGKVSKFIITSPSSFVDGNGASASMEYIRTGDKTCSISYKYDSSPMVSFGRKFVFTSATGGDYYHDDKKMGTFTFVTKSNNDSSSDDNDVNEPDVPAVADYAPESLPVGKVLEFSHGTSTVYQYKIASEEAVIVDGTTCSAEYIKNGKNTATLKVSISGMERIWELTFRDEESGKAQYNSQGTVYDEYTFRLTADGGSESPSDDDTDAGDSSDPGSDDTDVVGFAPDNLPVGCIFERIMPNGITAKFRINSATQGVIPTSDMSFTYVYTKKDKNSATFSVTPASGGTYSHDLVFTSSDSGTCVLHNSVGDHDCRFRIVPASSDDNITDDDDDTDNSDDNDTPEVELAPADLHAYEFHYISSSGGMAFFFVNNEHNRNVIVRYAPDSSWCEIGNYVYTKTGKTTATLSYSVSEMNGGWNSETQGALSLTFNANGTVTVSGSTIDTTIPGGQTNTYTINATYRVELDQD